MRIKNFLPLAIIISLVICHFGSKAQVVIGMFEKARTLGKGQVELSPQYSHYFVAAYGESGSVSNNVGLRAGLGLLKNVDLKLRYERLFPTGQDHGSNTSYNYFSLVPKVSIIANQLSFFIPVSFYRFKKTYSVYGTSKTKINSVAPHLIYTYTAASNRFDFSPSVNASFFWEEKDILSLTTWTGINIGAGFSSDLSRWAVRPETGLQFNPGGGGLWWHIGLGFQFMLPGGKKDKQ
jgi:hypothetical protein